MLAATMAFSRHLPDASTLAWQERASGDPHPWPRVWAVSARTLDVDESLSRLRRWLAGEHLVGLLRCGVAERVAPDGTRVLIVVAVDAIADLYPVRRSVRVGEWLDVQALFRVSVHHAKVVVLGPSGAPRMLLTSMDGPSVRARFAPDRNGMFTLQIIGEVAGGPRPLLEATVFAGIDPPRFPSDDSAPGERISVGAMGDDDILAAMMNAARTESGLAPMRRSVPLDSVARAHASAMAKERELAHDVGDGAPAERFAAAGVVGVEIGENVARADSVGLAHRQIWNSPSHRANLLSDKFTSTGVAVVRDARGELWIAEEFGGR